MKLVAYRHPGGWSVTFSPEVTTRWATALQDPVECGGILLGNRFDESSDLLVDSLTEPQAGDQRGPTRFYRDAPAHQRLVDQAWKQSEGRRVYLGEWHTHTSGRPEPSLIDKLTWTRFVGEAARLPLVFVVVTPSGLAVWGTALRGRLEPLRADGVCHSDESRRA